MEIMIANDINGRVNARGIRNNTKKSCINRKYRIQKFILMKKYCLSILRRGGIKKEKEMKMT